MAEGCDNGGTRSKSPFLTITLGQLITILTVLGSAAVASINITSNVTSQMAGFQSDLRNQQREIDLLMARVFPAEIGH